MMTDPKPTFGRPSLVPADAAEPVPEEPLSPSEYFADPQARVRLDEAHGLPPGLWLEVRKQLSWGQELALQAAVIGKTIKAGADMEIDFERAALLKLLTWVTAWSLTEPDPATGEPRPAPLDEPHLRGLYTGLARRINDAVDAHIARVAEGNAPGPSPTG